MAQLAGHDDPLGPVSPVTKGANMIHFTERYFGAAGIVPQFLSELDPRPAVEQIDTAYAHGGGWRDFEGFIAHIDWKKPGKSFLSYSGDPPMRAKAFGCLRDELVILFDSDWCAVAHPDRITRIARLD